MAHVPASSASYPIRRRISRHYWTTSLSRDLQNFVVQLLPSPEELTVKEDVRKLLERLIRTIEPESRLLSFGSTANGFSLRNSDMDLCCLIDSAQPPLSASDLVTVVGDLLERETKFQVKTLPHARIPIVKLSLDPSPGFPYGISCDIGFENRLALENTRLLMSYASIDPLRVRTLVIFLKVWSKRRKINSPYSGTLSSYGYVLLVIYFLVHVKNPPVLPNLQQMPPLRPISHEETHIGTYNVWFFDDIDLLRQRWQSSNTDSIGDLLIDFFKYYSRDFSYNTGAASIRAGLLKKSSKGWQSDDARDSARDRNRLCIEDPFETDYNVARCVTKEGLYTIRGEFMRASRILAARPERTIMALAQLCEERDVEFVRPLAPQPFIPPRMASSLPTAPQPQPLHVQTVTQGLDSLPPTIFESIPGNTPDLGSNLTSGTETFGTAVNPNSSSSSPVEMALPQPRDPPPHMAPRRAKWTSPPPPDDPDRIAYEDRLGAGLSLATSSSAARQPNRGRSGASSSSSEILTDEDHERIESESVGSFVSTDGIGPVDSTGVRSINIEQTSSMGSSVNLSLSQSFPKRPLSFFGPPEPPEYEPSCFVHHELSAKNPSIEATEDDADGWLVISTPKPSSSSASTSGGIIPLEDSEDSIQGTIRGRPPLRFGFVAETSLTPVPVNPIPYPIRVQYHQRERPPTSDSPRRSLSGPPALRTRGGRWANFIPAPLHTFVPGLIPNEDQIPTRTESTASPNTATNESINGSRSNSGSNSSSSSITGLNTIYYSSPPSTSSSIRTPFPLYQGASSSLSSATSATSSISTSYTKTDTPLDTARGYPVNAIIFTPTAASTPIHSDTNSSMTRNIDTTPSTISSIPISIMPSVISGPPVSDNPVTWHKQGNGHAHFGGESQHHPSPNGGSTKVASIPVSITNQQHLADELHRAYDATPTPKSREPDSGKVALSPKNTNTMANSKDRNSTAVQSPSPRVQATQFSQTSAAALEALLPVLNENAGHLNISDDNL